MADKVKGVIEAMVWDLRSLEKRGIFSSEELRKIISSREDFEYRLNKNTVRDYEFLQALKYEMELVGISSNSLGGSPKGESRRAEIEES
jgi:hypothetical protein